MRHLHTHSMASRPVYFMSDADYQALNSTVFKLQGDDGPRYNTLNKGKHAI